MIPTDGAGQEALPPLLLLLHPEYSSSWAMVRLDAVSNGPRTDGMVVVPQAPAARSGRHAFAIEERLRCCCAGSVLAWPW